MYAAASLLIIQDIDSAEQQFLMGHTADVCALSAAEDTPLVASAQMGELPIIRLWDRDTCMPLAIVQQHASDIHCLSLSADGALLAAVGKDARGRQLLAVWDVTQAAAPIPSCPLLNAKVSQTHIKAIQWVKPDPMDVERGPEKSTESMVLISCGYENIRFWRLRRGKLHACGMPLQHEEDCLFLSIAVDDPAHGGGGPERVRQRRLLVGGSNGRLFVIDPNTRTLEYVHALHDDAINAVHLSAGFAVTGGADRKLRVWPLDFSAHFLEAEHEGGVTAIHASPDQLKLLIGTASGTIGMLDVPTLKHATVVRSHTDIIYGLAIDPHNREFVTASCDGSIRVWELDGNQAQLVEFELPSGCSRAVAYHPTEYAIACGFDDGSLRIFDIASTSLLEEYTQHAGPVVDLLYSHAADRLFSAGTDCTITSYDVLHSYQPSRNYAAARFTSPSPCLAIASDDTLLVAGGLQEHALLLIDAAALTVLKAFPLAANAAAVAFGPSRTLFMTTTEGALVSVPLNADAEATAVTPGAHRAAADALTLSRNGRHVVTGGRDRMIKLWPTSAVVEGTALTSGTAAGACQPYAGHADHVTRLAFSSDGQTLVSVGGGDAIFLWEFKGPPGVDPAEFVEESVRQAEAERAERVAQYEGGDETLPTPAQVLSSSSASDVPAPASGGPAPKPAWAHPAAAAAVEPTAAPASAASADFEALRQRLQNLGTAEAGYMMAGVEAAMKAARVQTEGAVPEDAATTVEPEDRGDDVFVDDADEEDEDEDEDEDEGEEVPAGPRKRFVARLVYGDTDEAAAAGAAETAMAAQAAGDVPIAVTPDGGHGAADEQLANVCATGLQLERLNGFSTHAHDHVIWQPATATLLYATGDTLVVDGVAPGSSPTYLTGGSGEIATLALSNDGRFAAVGSGGDAPTCIYDLAPRGRDLELAMSGESVHVASPTAVLRMRLPGHEGGVQCLAFLGNAALASLGLHDGGLRVHSIISGALLLSAETPPCMHTLAVSADGMELSAAGRGGIFTWRVSTAPTDDGASSAALAPMPRRAHGGPEELTALAHLSPTLSLSGDSSGVLHAWGPANGAGAPIAAFDLSAFFSEIDLLHATPVILPVSPGDVSTFHVVVGGCGPSNAIARFHLTVPPATAGGAGELLLTPVGDVPLDADAIAMSWDAAGEQGVVGTTAGSVWHLTWASGAATLLVGAVPPPLASMAVPNSHAPPGVIASLSRGDVQGEMCGVLLWDNVAAGASDDTKSACAAPLARIYQPTEPATCVAISPPTAEFEAYAEPDGADGLCCVGYASGRVQLVSISSLKLLRERRVHTAALCAVAFGPARTLVTAASDGEVRLHSAAMGELLTPLATLRAPTNVAITCLDLLFAPGDYDDAMPPRWAVASATQQVQVWPLLARTDANVPPLATIDLETSPLLTVPAKLQTLGWKCLVAFCRLRPEVVACSGLTRLRHVLLYDYVACVPLARLNLDEWPTALAACPEAPLLAVGGASGAVKFVEYLPEPETRAEADEEAELLSAVGTAGLVRSAATVELHCHNVRGLAFSGACLYSAGEDEMARWLMPL